MTNQITNIKVHADKYPGTSSPYWNLSADSTLEGWAFNLLSDCNASHYDYMHTDYFKSVVCAVFNHNESDVTVPEGLRIEFKKKRFCRQSAGRYMNPKNEGFVTLTVHSKGVVEKGFRWLQSVDLKFFIVGAASEGDFERALGSLLSPDAKEACRLKFK